MKERSITGSYNDVLEAFQCPGLMRFSPTETIRVLPMEVTRLLSMAISGTSEYILHRIDAMSQDIWKQIEKMYTMTF
jgi:hypothetical protein